eukprot:795123-Amphidinium_carterae.3
MKLVKSRRDCAQWTIEWSTCKARIPRKVKYCLGKRGLPLECSRMLFLGVNIAFLPASCEDLRLESCFIRRARLMMVAQSLPRCTNVNGQQHSQCRIQK